MLTADEFIENLPKTRTEKMERVKLVDMEWAKIKAIEIIEAMNYLAASSIVFVNTHWEHTSKLDALHSYMTEFGYTVTFAEYVNIYISAEDANGNTKYTHCGYKLSF